MGNANSAGVTMGGFNSKYDQMTRSGGKQSRKVVFIVMSVLLVLVSEVCIWISYFSTSTANQEQTNTKPLSTYILLSFLTVPFCIAVAWLFGWWVEFTSAANITRAEQTCKRRGRDDTPKHFQDCVEDELITQQRFDRMSQDINRRNHTGWGTYPTDRSFSSLF